MATYKAIQVISGRVNARPGDHLEIEDQTLADSLLAVKAIAPIAPVPVVKVEAVAVGAAPATGVNTATVDQLAEWFGVSKTAARAIAKGRPYESLDALKELPALAEFTDWEAIAL